MCERHPINYLLALMTDSRSQNDLCAFRANTDKKRGMIHVIGTANKAIFQITFSTHLAQSISIEYSSLNIFRANTSCESSAEFVCL